MKSPDSPFRIDPQDSTPLYRQIYQRIKLAIINGTLLPGARLPSLRALAGELGTARGTIEAAYALLSGEGYLENHRQGGMRVSASLDGVRPPAGNTPAAEVVHRAGMTFSTGQLMPFQLGVPALDAFPLGQWNRILSKCARQTRRDELSHPSVQGYAPLREALASYLQVSRGVQCGPEQIFITAGYRSALELAIQAVLEEGDTAWVEDPCYPFARRLLQSYGLRTVAVPVDRDGLRVEQGETLCPAARLALVTPAHQSPTGVSMSLARRMRLLEWARTHQGWILEDDYDGEFHYTGRPLPALKSLDRYDRVLYAGTFSKVLFPGLRLAYLVVPEGQTGRFRQAAFTRPCVSPTVIQAAVAHFIHEGHFYRHLKKMRLLYVQRRAYLAQALEQQRRYPLHVALQAGGLHLLAALPLRFDDALIAREGRVQGLALEALSDWRIDPANGETQGLLLGFTNVAAPEMAQRHTAALLNVLDRCSPVAGGR